MQKSSNNLTQNSGWSLIATMKQSERLPLSFDLTFVNVQINYALMVFQNKNNSTWIFLDESFCAWTQVIPGVCLVYHWSHPRHFFKKKNMRPNGLVDDYKVSKCILEIASNLRDFSLLANGTQYDHRLHGKLAKFFKYRCSALRHPFRLDRLPKNFTGRKQIWEQYWNNYSLHFQIFWKLQLGD